MHNENYQKEPLTHLQKSQASQLHAQKLSAIALDEASQLFEQGDLRPYVEVLSRFHSYNFYNLLLILKQYPAATCLASYGEWAQVLGDPREHVLKQGSFKSLIEMVSPCSNRLAQNSGAITWQAITKIDISQTNVTNFQPPSKGYLSGSVHVHLLIFALCTILSEQYGISVLYEYADPATANVGSAGYRDETCIHMWLDAPQSEQLHWLCGVLVDLTKPEQVLGNPYKDYFRQLATVSLLRIWDICDPGLLFLPKRSELVRTVPSELQPTFLSLLQRRVRSIEENVRCIYQARIRSREEEAGILGSYALDSAVHQISSEGATS